jgi:hypothetical protein
MMRKSAVQIFLATVVAIGAGFLVSRNVPRVYASTSPVAFTAEYVVTTHNATNVELQNALTLYAQKADGSFVMLQKTVGPGIPNGLRRILNMQTKRMVTVDPETMSLSTYVYADPDLEFYRHPSATCEQHKNFTRDPGPQPKVFGFEVIRFSGTLPASENMAERWLAPDLNCFALREEMTMMPDRSKHRRVTKSVNLGEPDPALFEIPVTGYTERSPSEVLTLARKKQGVPPSAKSAHTNGTLDKVYTNHRPK